MPDEIQACFLPKTLQMLVHAQGQGLNELRDTLQDKFGV